MLGLLAQEQIEFIMTNHTYIVDCQIYLQSSGGPIGIDFSRILARLMMIVFDVQLKDRIKNHRSMMILQIHQRYMDDENLSLDVLRIPGITRMELEEDTALIIKELITSSLVCSVW